MSHSSNLRKKQIKRTNSCKPLRYVFQVDAIDHIYVKNDGKYKAVQYVEGTDY
jgi:hypothetical protein